MWMAKRVIQLISLMLILKLLFIEAIWFKRGSNTSSKISKISLNLDSSSFPSEMIRESKSKANAVVELFTGTGQSVSFSGFKCRTSPVRRVFQT
jgi:hypothetical protein